MKSIYRSFVILFLLVIIYPLVSYAGPPSIPSSGVTSYSQIVGLFGSGSCTGFLYSDGTCTTPAGGGDVLGPASSTQYKIPLWGGTNKTLVDGVAVGTEGMILRSAGAGANPAWSAYTLALPGAAGATLYSDGTNWTRSAAPSLLALTLYGQSSGGGAQLSLGSSSGSTDPNNGKMNFRNSTNGFIFSITSGVTGADIGWTLPTAVSGGDNYLLNVDADGTMGYTAPSTFLAATALDDTKGNGDTAYLWSADKIYDQLALKLGTSAKAADADKLDNHDSTYFQVAGSYLTSANIAASISDSDTTHCPDGNSIYDALALKQNYSSVLAALAGIAITVDGNNVTFPGAIITTAADGSRKLAVLANTVGVDATSDAFELYPDSDDLWKLNQHGTEYTFVLNGLASTNLILPSSNADPATTAGQIRHDSTDSNAASDGSIKVFTGNHVNTLVSATAVADDSYTIITKTEYIPIAYAENGAAAPAAASVWADTRKAKIRVFAADADDDVEIHWMVPDDYVGGIKFRVVGFVDNATAPADTETVIFNLAGCSVGNSDDGGCTLGTGVDSTFTADATYAQHDRWSSAWSNEITVTNIVAGESAMLKLFRDVDDTYGQGIGVAGIEIKYKARVLMADRY